MADCLVTEGDKAATGADAADLDARTAVESGLRTRADRRRPGGPGKATGLLFDEEFLSINPRGVGGGLSCPRTWRPK